MSTAEPLDVAALVPRADALGALRAMPEPAATVTAPTPDLTDRPVLLHGDARALILPDESVDLVVTSPPYLQLRDYGYDGQIGTEATPREFVDALIACTREMVRVLKPSGSIFVNLGDKYGPDKGLRLIPERYRIRCTDELGLIARAVIVWDKPNGLPESVTDRVRRSHEDWVHLTKSPRYFAAVDEIREPYALDSSRMSKLGATSMNARNRSIDGGAAAQRIPNPLGKLPGSVWTIATQPLRVPAELNVDHFATFPMEWPRRLITGWCPPDGTVLDPFGGTGTTAMVAHALGRRGISVDLSTDYQRIAHWRTTDPKERAKAARPMKWAKATPEPAPLPEPSPGTVSLTLITPRDAGTTTHLEGVMDATDEAPDRAAPTDPERPWSGREETDRVTHGFPPWRRLDEPVSVSDDPTPSDVTEPGDDRHGPATPPAPWSGEYCALCDMDEHACPGCGTPTPHERIGLRSPCADCERETREQQEAENADELEQGPPESLIGTEAETLLDEFADGGKASVKDLRPAVRAALDELARLRGEVARSRVAGVEHPAPEPEPVHDISAEWNTANERDRARAERDTALAALDRFRADSAQTDTEAYDRGWSDAIADATLRAASDAAYDRGWNVGRAVGVEDAEMSRTAYDRGWSDAIADAIGNRIWAGAPLAWRHVQPGDVVLTDPDEDNPAGVPWIVDANDEARGTFARKVTLRGAGTRADAELDPDTTATVLLPAAERAAIVALRTGLDARIGDRS